MAENLVNDKSTTLGAAIANGTDTAITVASGTGFPAANFRIRIDDEIMLVTSVGGGTNWTVTRAVEGTTGVAHSNGASVYHVLSVTGLQNYIKEQASGRNAIWVPAAGMAPWATNPATYLQGAWTNQPYRLWSFDPTTEQYVHFQLGAPKRWNLSTITAKFVIMPTTSNANSTVWGIKAAAMGAGDSYDVAMGTAVTSTIASGSGILPRHSAETGALTIAGTPAIDDFMNFQVYRKAADAADTDTTAAYLIGMWLYFTTTYASDD